jgi:hypothetical protein
MKGIDSEEMISTEMVSDSRKVVDSYSSQTHGQDMLLSGKSGKHKKIWPFDGWFGDGKKKGAKKKDSEVEELKEDETNEEESEEADESGASDKPDESEESDESDESEEADDEEAPQDGKEKKDKEKKRWIYYD